MTRQTRRTFLKRAAATAGVATTFTIAGTSSSGQVLGANDTIRLGVAGINGRGRSHMGEFSGKNGVQVTHLIDPDSRLFASRADSIKSSGGNTPKCFQDIRKALDDKELDAVSIASTNHWHALLAIWSCQAGKDVYVEKPCSHNVFEGRKLVEAAAKYKCIVQHGTQSRSDSGWQKQIAAVASGKYGKLLISYGYASKPRGSIGFAQPEDPPAELDFDLWLGPARKQPYHRNLVHYNWHWFWDFGCGEIGNQGVHQMDIARWAVEAATGATLPKSVISLGGRFGYEDQGQTPNTQLTIYDFGEAKMFFEDYGLVNNDRKVTNEFYMEEGAIKGGKFYPKGSDKGQDLVDVEYTCYPGGNFGNFINCVRSRKQEELNAPVEQAHLGAACCHLGNISYRMGQLAAFDKAPPTLGDDKDAVAAFEGMKEHLKRHDVKLEQVQCAVGRKLEFDPKAEKFVGDPRADALLTRPYREPFVVPENV
ncbi:MAG TPA: Gfo/Idh/MocA family oxidoreductase [Thermoguttaceae bacterium]|nr:Gfo/Idh/MocA family oxidoreductase [Thermoguttaceae bacterium]